jgi:hypothetical protein
MHLEEAGLEAQLGIDAQHTPSPAGDIHVSREASSSLKIAQDKTKKRRHDYPSFRRCDPVDQPIEKQDRDRFGAPLKFQIPNQHDFVYRRALEVVELLSRLHGRTSENNAQSSRSHLQLSTRFQRPSVAVVACVDAATVGAKYETGSIVAKVKYATYSSANYISMEEFQQLLNNMTLRLFNNADDAIYLASPQLGVTSATNFPSSWCFMNRCCA